MSKRFNDGLPHDKQVNRPERGVSPLFSIIVPVFNTARYLPACLRSALSQTNTDLELIIVDDGSSDESPIICSEAAAADTRVRLFRKMNEGQGIARNVGLACARGEYVLFLDSDDTLDERTCESVARAFESTMADVVSFGIQFQTEQGRVLARRVIDRAQQREGPRLFLDAMLDRDFLTSPCNKAYRRHLLTDNAISFPPLRAYEDSLFSRHVGYCAGSVYYVPEIFYYATTREGSTSRCMSVDNFRSAAELIALEERLFGPRLTERRAQAAFGAHVVRFFAHLLLLAAFRVEPTSERQRCYDLAIACGFIHFARQREVVELLSFRTRLQVAIARHPQLAHVAAGVAKRLNINPY